MQPSGERRAKSPIENRGPSNPFTHDDLTARLSRADHGTESAKALPRKLQFFNAILGRQGAQRLRMPRAGIDCRQFSGEFTEVGGVVQPRMIGAIGNTVERQFPAPVVQPLDEFGRQEPAEQFRSGRKGRCLVGGVEQQLPRQMPPVAASVPRFVRVPTENVPAPVSVIVPALISPAATPPSD